MQQTSEVQCRLSGILENVGQNTKSFRMRTTSLFLTYPQNASSKEIAMDRILSKWKDQILFAVVSQEKHKDGADHLHVAIKFKNRISFTGANFANFIGQSQGNYQPARNIKKVLAYVMKDGNYIAHGAVPFSSLKQPQIGTATKQLSKFDLIAEAIINGATLDQIKKDYPGFYLNHALKIKNYISETQRDRKKDSLLTWPDNLNLVDTNEFTEVISRWLITNIKQKREFKQAQLWLTSPPNCGKSTLISNLGKYLNIFWIPNEDFFDNWKDDFYDLAVFDEMVGCHSITFWNQFLQGSTQPLRIKGAQTIKNQNIPVIIASNHSPREIYHKAKDVQIQSLICRLREVIIPQGIWIGDILDQMIKSEESPKQSESQDQQIIQIVEEQDEKKESENESENELNSQFVFEIPEFSDSDDDFIS